MRADSSDGRVLLSSSTGKDISRIGTSRDEEGGVSSSFLLVVGVSLLMAVVQELGARRTGKQTEESTNVVYRKNDEIAVRVSCWRHLAYDGGQDCIDNIKISHHNRSVKAALHPTKSVLTQAN